MQPQSLVLRTELAVARLSSAVDDRGDHLVITTAAEPDFFWGSFLAIAPPRTAPAAEVWLARAAAATPPGAAHAALMIDAIDGALAPNVAAALVAAGATIETTIAMVCDQPLRAVTAADVTVRRFDRPADWAALLGLSLTIDPETPALRRFLEVRIAARAAAAALDQVRWWGAFAGPTLVASAGVVPLADCARYQDVQTHPDHRRRGLASAILAAIAVDQRAAGRTRLVLVVAEDNAPARAAYQRLGFVERDRAVNALRPPLA
ncbi:MAG: GNAT family N-acetyltransferase [Myxococcales bacterium]|nr:GNAT family N-acetyltransferase [Myxococcales bacterium]